jgi:hypothetical protein
MLATCFDVEAEVARLQCDVFAIIFAWSGATLQSCKGLIVRVGKNFAQAWSSEKGDLRMTDEQSKPIPDIALGMMNAVIPGMLDDPVKAWREFVPRLRYVVIAKTESPTVAQLKALQMQSNCFCNVQASNLVEIRTTITRHEIKLEPTPEEVAAAAQRALAETGLHVTLVPLTGEEIIARLVISNDLPSGNSWRELGC